jgi:hypothetical protein
LHFEVAAAEERAGADEGAGGEILGDVAAVDLVEFFVEGEILGKKTCRETNVRSAFRGRWVANLQTLPGINSELDSPYEYG